MEGESQLRLEDPFGGEDHVFDLEADVVVTSPQPTTLHVSPEPQHSDLDKELIDRWVLEVEKTDLLTVRSDSEQMNIEILLQEAHKWPTNQRKRDVLAAHPSFVLKICDLLRIVAASALQKEGPSMESLAAQKSQLSALTSLLRLTRNLCPNCTESQDKLRAGRFDNVVLPLITSLAEESSVLQEEEKGEEEKAKSLHITPCLRMAIQAAGNFITGNDTNKELVWSTWFPSGFLILLKQKDKTVQSSVCMLLHNSIHAHPKWRDLVVESKELTELLISIVSVEDEKPQENSAFDWVYLLFAAFFKDGRFAELFNAFKPTTSSLVSKEQTLLLKLVDGALHRHLQSNQDSPIDSILPFGSCLRLAAIFDGIYHSLMAESMKEKEKEKEKTETDEGRFRWLESVNRTKFLQTLEEGTTYEALFLLLQIFGVLSAANTEAKDYELKSALNDKGFLTNALGLLAVLHYWDECLYRATPAPPKPTGEVEACLPAIKRDLVMVVTNMCFRHRANQDLVGKEGYVPLILAQARLDDRNPLIREWAILAIRNLCEEHDYNQSIIQGLQPRGAAENKELRDLGLEVAFEGGKFSVRKKQE